MRLMAVFVFCLVFIFCAPAFAQGEGRGSPNALAEGLKHKFSQNYKKLVDKIYSTGKFENYDLMHLRGYYPNTEQYSAFSDDIINAMVELSYTVQNSNDSKAVNDSLTQYNILVRQHFANLEVIFMAAALSEQDVRFGDSEFYKKVRDSYYKSILDHEDGLSLAKAVKVITFGEEDIILKRLKGKLVKSDIYENDVSVINIHQMQDSKTNKITKYFFDLTLPITKSKAMQEDKKRRHVQRGAK